MYYVTIINAIYADLPEQLPPTSSRSSSTSLPPLGWPCSARRVFALKLKKFSLCAVRRPPNPAPRQSSPADCALIYMLNNFCALVRREIVSNASHIKAKYDSALSCAVLALSCVLFATSKYMHCFYCYCFSHVSPLSCAFCSCPLPFGFAFALAFASEMDSVAHIWQIKSSLNHVAKNCDLKAEFKKNFTAQWITLRET